MEQAKVDVGVGIEEPRARRFLHIYEEAWARPFTGELAELWARDADMIHPEFTEPMSGRDKIMEYLRGFLDIAPDLKVQPLRAALNVDTLFIHFRAEATVAGTKLAWEGVDVFELAGDQATRGSGFFDTTAIRQALGISGVES